MMKTIEAVYEQGVFRPISPVDLPEHCHVRLQPILIKEFSEQPVADRSRFNGVIKLTIDPLEFQKQIREEWE